MPTVGFPRHACRGLIEAVRPAALRRAAPTRFPRHACRGLIEALEATIEEWMGAYSFRGMRAAASLKRNPARNRHHRNRRFRGMRAAASLKLAHGVGSLVVGWKRFRGMRAAASLKPGLADVEGKYPQLFPRHACRGEPGAAARLPGGSCRRPASGRADRGANGGRCHLGQLRGSASSHRSRSALSSPAIPSPPAPPRLRQAPPGTPAAVRTIPY